MITVVWAVLGALVCAGMYAAMRVLARDDMPLSNLPGLGCSAAAPGFSAQAGEPGLPGPVLSTPINGEHEMGLALERAGESAYQVLYAMATAVNDAWLERLFGGHGA